MSAPVGRPIALSLSGRLMLDPFPSTSCLIYGATGSAKTTSSVMTSIQGLLADTELAMIANDVKDGEILAQIAPMCEKHGRKFGGLDDFEVFGADCPFTYSLNPFGAITATAKETPADLLFAIEGATHALIPEPPNDTKNQFFRDTPREELDCGIRILLDHMPGSVTPGALYSLMADPDLWQSAREIAAEEGDLALQSRAKQSLDMQNNDPEQYYKHLRAALTVLRIYEPGSALHNAGQDATLTHDQIIDEAWIFCLVQPQRHAGLVGAHYALHLQSFQHAQMTKGSGRALYILDELCNAPLKSAVKSVTVMRSYGGRCLYVAQSRKDIEAKYGVRETAVLEDNCPVKIWLSFNSFEEAERVSKAMGETRTVTHSVGVNSDKLDYSGAINTGMERVMTADELMRLDPSLMIVHIKGGPFILCRKLFQNQIAPTCYDLGDNPQEGGRLPPDPKVEMAVPTRRAT